MNAPSQTPDRGYMGDRARGASLGRSSSDPHALIKRLQSEIADDTRRADEHEADPQLDWHIWPAGSDARADMIGAARLRATKNQACLDALSPWLADCESQWPRVHLAGIRLDSGGYDQGGAYWGFSGWLWEAWTDDGAFYETGRVTGGDERKAAVERLRAAGMQWPSTEQIDRETAKAAVRESMGELIRFYR